MTLNLILLDGAAAQAGGAGLMNILMIVALIAVFYLFLIRPQKKRQKEIKKFREDLTQGSRVMTAGGIHGKIRSIKETAFVVEIAPNVQITVDKNSVYPAGASSEDIQNPEVTKS
ncbi:MAG: preprotein translocase subunit YajC [Muribaculaceae bacterium]|nr:preprotein translocase subunit YajC [Muribaculaceae bacterium]